MDVPIESVSASNTIEQVESDQDDSSVSESGCTIEEVVSDEEVPCMIEQVDSDEEVHCIQQVHTGQMAGKMVEAKDYWEREHICIMMEHVTLWISNYLRHIGEDWGVLTDGTTAIVEAFERWSVMHFIMTQCQISWSVTRNIFIGSSQAFSLFKRPATILRACPPYNVAAGIASHQVSQQPPFSTEFTRMGIAMEDVIREFHVALFSHPLKTAKPGRVLSTRGPIGLSCTGDIELLNDEGEVVCLMEVKTLCKASVTPGLSIPDTIKKAREAVREILANNQQFTNFNPRRGNIFSEQKRFIRLDFLEQYGHVHARAQLNKFSLHTHVGADEFLQCCRPQEGQRVDLYFYEPDDTIGQPAQSISMCLRDFGLTLNPLCPTAFQMLCQQCVYHTSSCRTISHRGAGLGSWMNLLLVIPYAMDSAQPKPYMIMKMPVFFSDGLCAQVYRFYADELYKYISPPHSTTAAITQIY